MAINVGNAALPAAVDPAALERERQATAARAANPALATQPSPGQPTQIYTPPPPPPAPLTTLPDGFSKTTSNPYTDAMNRFTTAQGPMPTAGPTAVAPPAPVAPAAPPTGPASPVAPPTPGLFSGPGAYEEWIKKNSSRLDTPTNVENLYKSGIADGLSTSSPLNNVSNVGPGAYQAWLAGAGAGGPGVGASGDVLNSLSTGPSGGPSVGSSLGVLGSLSTGPDGGPEALNSRGVLDSLATGPSNSTGVYGQAQDALGDQGALEDKFDRDGGAFDSTGDFENFFRMYGDDPMDKSYSETLYEAGSEKLDPFYDYAEKRAMDAAQRGSAARGGFNSGLAAQQESDITGNLRGQQAQSMFDLAPVADSAKRARYTQGADFAETGQDQYSKRINDAFGLAAADQQAEEARYRALSGIAATGDSADTARDNTRVTAGANADDASIGAFASEWAARNAAGANRVSAAGNADDASVAGFAAEWNARNNAGTNRVNAAGNQDQSAIGAYNATATAQGRGEQLALDQWLANAGLAEKQDASRRANLNTEFNLAGASDNSAMGRFLTQGGLAEDQQNAGQNRLGTGMNTIAEQSQREAQLATQVYNDMSSVNSLDTVQLQALADKYGIALQQMQDIVGAGGDAAAMLIKILTGK